MVWCLFLLFFAEPFDTHFRTGVLALNQNDFAVAEAQLEAAAKIEPRDSRVWLALAQTYSKLRKPSEAQGAAKKAETFARDPGILHGLSLYYAEAANYAKAAELEARFAESAPGAIPRAVDLFLRAGQPKSAITTGRKAAATSAELHNLLGKAYQADGDFASAVREYHAAIQKNRYNEAFYFDLVQAHLTQQKFAEALEVLGGARDYFDKSPQLELAAGVAYYALRRFPEAIDAFLRTIKLDPAVEQPYVFLSRMLEQAEDKRASITQAFAALSQKAPENYLACFLYGKVLAAEDPDRAEKLLRKSIEQNEPYWESHFELGVLLERGRRFEEAAREIARSAELNPNDPAPYYRLARLYERLGKSAEAREARARYEKLSAAGPGSK
jgi:tetratricopeptide (TPR) repeat protein